MVINNSLHTHPSVSGSVYLAFAVEDDCPSNGRVTLNYLLRLYSDKQDGHIHIIVGSFSLHKCES